MDGHGSHVTWQFIQFCLQNNIICFCLPAHSTHLLQPLDVGLFSPLEQAYTSLLDDHQKDGNWVLNKGVFLQ